MINLKLSIEYPFTRSSFNHIFNRSWNTFIKNKHFEIEVLQDCEHLLNFDFNWTTRCDHAGVRLELSLFGYTLMFYFYDNRHWDYKTNNWMTHEC
jgi:hypothetical protein